MSQRKFIKILILFLCGLILFSAIGLVILWLQNTQRNNDFQTNTNSIFPRVANIEISQGQKVLIREESAETKLAAAQDMAAENYQMAMDKLTQSLQTYPNDPEALIYLNNAQIGNNKSYSIAVAAPIATNTNGAKEILRGVAQAQQEINQAGGIKGIPLKVVIANDHNSPEIAKKLAQELANDADILGVIGHWSSDVTLASAEIYQSEQLVVISPVSTSVELSSFGDYIFRTVPSDRFAGSALSRYMVNQLGRKKAAIFFNSQSNYSQSLKDEFTKSLFSDGGEIVGEFDLSQKNFDPNNDWQQAKNQGAEVLMLALTTDTIEEALAVIKINKKELFLLGGDDGYNTELLQRGAGNAVGMVLAIPWHISAHNNDPFVGVAKRLWGGEISWRTALAYDATLALINGLGETPNPTRQSLQATLSKPNFSFQGASGSVNFLPSGDRNQAVQLVRVKANNLAEFGYEFHIFPSLNSN
ncbi:unknown [Crocosphaera subtropica ATCC 51142]|uniref:Leucine-binding protein domain-containing protein n=1 Tax=Crocosphaera subtropica (strain ATCC 51142 / BH68) TaxID=43989 RepID=B1WW27_CROS5|nr:ABC transporter substrate-binding protein [Crocosphaera subtropica]ACB52360.1 unknown [Crocosphaera subtropica ATCC 51142]